MIDLTSAAGHFEGTCGFRLMPDDELALAPTTATLTEQSNGHAWTLAYTWRHPADGLQAGLLLVRSPDDEGAVTAALTDSWHQKPGLGILEGRGTNHGAVLAMTYAGDWGWTIEVTVAGDDLHLSMHNVVPEGVEAPDGAAPAEPGPYLVMDAQLTRIAS